MERFDTKIYVNWINTPERLARLAKIIDTMLEAWLKNGPDHNESAFRYNFSVCIYEEALYIIGESKLWEWLNKNQDNNKYQKYVDNLCQSIKMSWKERRDFIHNQKF